MSQPKPTTSKLVLDWNELNSATVDARLKELDQVRSTSAHFEKASIPEFTRSQRSAFAWLYTGFVYMTLFGLLGAIIGWSIGQVLGLRPDTQSEARQLASDWDEVQRAVDAEKFTPAEAKLVRDEIRSASNGNAYFDIYINPELTPDEKAARTETLMKADTRERFTADLLLFAASGMAIAAALAIADNVMERNWTAVLINAAIGAVLGLVGGVIAAFVAYYLQDLVAGQIGITDTRLRIAVARTLCWGLVGVFIAAAPGLVLRSGKRTIIGIAGGLIGGLLGGALFDFIAVASGSLWLANLLGLLAIGAGAGLASGLIEQAVKTGWLQVIAGPIAGKQFILYRDPTYIGAHPMSHIYLFRDALVGRRHAAIHHAPGGGFELENLPLGTPTLVNDREIDRARLRHGDILHIGRTKFRFEMRGEAA